MIVLFFIFGPIILVFALFGHMARNARRQKTLLHQNNSMLRELKLANLTPEQKIKFLEAEKSREANASMGKLLCGTAVVVVFIVLWHAAPASLRPSFGGATRDHSDSSVPAEAVAAATPYVEPTPYEHATPTPYEQPTPMPQATPYGGTEDATPTPTVKRALPVTHSHKHTSHRTS
jgi:hypothetical protein